MPERPVVFDNTRWSRPAPAVHLIAPTLHGIACNHNFRRTAPRATKDPAKVTCRICRAARLFDGEPS